ncbi:MAG: hypothetical protein II773_09160 [Oscillospiraceae bacterium]|nr:hypothetical protein [Oscillospiraceae bacterium]
MDYIHCTTPAAGSQGFFRFLIRPYGLSAYRPSVLRNTCALYPRQQSCLFREFGIGFLLPPQENRLRREHFFIVRSIDSDDLPLGLVL